MLVSLKSNFTLVFYISLFKLTWDKIVYYLEILDFVIIIINFNF